MIGRAQGLCLITLCALFAHTPYGMSVVEQRDKTMSIDVWDPDGAAKKSGKQESVRVRYDQADDTCDGNCKAEESGKTDAELLYGDATADEMSVLACDPDGEAPMEQLAERTQRSSMGLVAAAILALIAFARMIWGKVQDLSRVQSKTSAELSDEAVGAQLRAEVEQRRRRDENDLADVRAQLREQGKKVNVNQ